MALTHGIQTFSPDEYTISRNKDFGQDRSLNCTIVLATEKFTDFQRDLIEDFLSVLIDRLSEEDITFSSFKESFEKELQDLNTKLSVFAEKIKDVEKFSLKGIVQVFFDGAYVASMIGKVSVMIFRNEKLNYSLTNYIQDKSKIDLFTEFVEGDVDPDDEIISLGVAIDTYLDKEDFETVVEMSQSDDIPLYESLVNLLEQRVEKEQIGFAQSSLIETNALITQKKVKKKVLQRRGQLSKYATYLEEYRSLVSIAGISVLVLGLIFWLVQSFMQGNQGTFTDTNGGVVIDFTIDDIQKDIAIFKKIDPSSDEKIKKYQSILAQLDLLESNNKWTFDVAELRKILEDEYYDGFNIVLMNDDTFFNEPMYTFSQQEKNTFGAPSQLFYRDGLQIVGSEGVLLGAINETVRGTLISAGLDTTLRACSQNLLLNGLFCVTEANEVFNILKSGLQPVTNVEGGFPTEITGLGRFRTANLYTITRDPTLMEANVPIVRYVNQIGSQEKFGEGTKYPLDETALAEYPKLKAGFSDIAIDGTFLGWSKGDRTLYQMWREGANTTLFARPISLLGGDAGGDQYSENVKVVASAESRYVYLFDNDNDTFTVYRSAPYKTNDANTTTYQLTYFFRLKFALPDMDVTDVFVQDGEKSVLYLLTKDNVFTMQLHDFMATYFEQEANE